MNKIFSILVLAAGVAISFASCSSNNDGDDQNQQIPSIGGVVQGKLLSDAGGQVDTFDCYGMLVPSFTPQELMDNGFEYSDMLNVKIGSNISLKDVPFVTGFNEVGVLETCFCDYNRLGIVYGFGQLHGNFRERIGGVMGDSIKVTLSKRHGYKDTWEIMKSVYDYDRSLYPNETDEEFANFRAVTTTGMGKGVLYRSSNPLNPKDNKVRFEYVDSLARHYAIKTEIDLADTQDSYATNKKRTDFTSTYCPELVENGQVVMLGLTADTYGGTFMKTLGDGLRFMLNHQPPYLLHCNEGKDRCGFVSMLLEAFAGATYQEVADDYMKTLMNFYRIEKDSESYNLRRQLSIDRLVWLLDEDNIKKVGDFGNIDWSDKDPKTVNLQKAADDYIGNCGLSSEERAQLKSILQTDIK